MISGLIESEAGTYIKDLRVCGVLTRQKPVYQKENI
jgi:hypothetical protein